MAALKEVLATLKGINEAMPDHQGFLPEELAARVGCPDPALWQEVYTEARIRPNKSNRLYRSRILYLIAYLERRLGLPLSRPPFPVGSSRRGGDRDGSRGGRYGDRGDRDGGRGDRGRYGDRDGGRGHYGRGGEAGGRGERDRGDRGGDRYGASARWEEGGGRGGERDGERGGEQQRHERENEVVEEQMESVEATPFLAIHHLPRYWSCPFFPWLSYYYLVGVGVGGWRWGTRSCGLVSSSFPTHRLLLSSSVVLRGSDFSVPFSSSHSNSWPRGLRPLPLSYCLSGVG